ncbi:MAG TPA: 3-methyl-2-oxobutanoate dehydrogenase subunit VorB [Chloroflexota bacterium]|nr:3-methyl-2-oxobutanoate dehydrogenase subunit VorB [Chloroflexota bacterium]
MAGIVNDPAAFDGRVLMEGNEAFGEGAIRAGCDAYFGYPITPQTELLEFMSRRMPALGRAFVQAESEVAAINMVLGAAASGARGMTSSSSPGISLKQEGISYLAGDELPAVIVNVMRGGPGLGNVAPSQGDYFQATKGGGHGVYHPIVLAPASVQEAMDLTALAFDLADRYRTPVMILADGVIGQTVEPVVLKEYGRRDDLPPKDWALVGCAGRERRIIKSIEMEPEVMERVDQRLVAKYDLIKQREVRWTGSYLDDARLAVVAFGTPARVSLSAARAARAAGIPVGLFRPITLFPFPEREIAELAGRVDAILVVELNQGQMVEDVERVSAGRTLVRHFGRLGGVVVSPEEVLDALKSLWEETR